MTDAPAPATRSDGKLTIALVSEVFWEPDGAVRLKQRLAEAAERGADLAVLPEIPLNPWSPATKEPRDDDAEQMDGPRSRAQAEAAAEAGIGLVGGIIHRAEDGRRTSRALVFDARGEVRATYEKLHLPEEDGFWETSHYEPGTAAPGRIDAFGVPIGVQICSDNNRPEGTHLLGAQGVIAALNPRATEERTYQRWKVVWRANALTSCCYVLSVNRPHPEGESSSEARAWRSTLVVTSCSKRPTGSHWSRSTPLSSPKRGADTRATCRCGPRSMPRRGARSRALTARPPNQPSARRNVPSPISVSPMYTRRT